MKVSLILPEHVLEVWPKVREYMADAAKYTYGRYETDDILDSITDYDHHLWIAYDDTGIKGAVVTCFIHYPRRKNLAMQFCGGKEGMTWKEPMLALLQKWAFDNECDCIESSGRAGWAKIFGTDGYKPLWYTYELPAGDVGIGG